MNFTRQSLIKFPISNATVVVFIPLLYSCYSKLRKAILTDFYWYFHAYNLSPCTNCTIKTYTYVNDATLWHRLYVANEIVIQSCLLVSKKYMINFTIAMGRAVKQIRYYCNFNTFTLLLFVVVHY